MILNTVLFIALILVVGRLFETDEENFKVDFSRNGSEVVSDEYSMNRDDVYGIGRHESIGFWKLSEGTENQTEEPYVDILVYDSETGKLDDWNGHTLWLRCLANRPEVWLLWVGSGGFIQDNNITVTYQLDDQQMASSTWRVDETIRARTYLNGNAIEFIKSLMGHRKLTIEAKNSLEGDVTTSFFIHDLDKAIMPVREACNW